MSSERSATWRDFIAFLSALRHQVVALVCGGVLTAVLAVAQGLGWQVKPSLYGVVLGVFFLLAAFGAWFQERERKRAAAGSDPHYDVLELAVSNLKNDVVTMLGLLGEQTKLLGDAASNQREMGAIQTKITEHVQMLADRNVDIQKEFMSMRPRRLDTENKDAISATASRLLAEYIQSYESFGTPWIDADGRPIRLCIAIATIGGETETVNYRQDIREAFQPTFEAQLEVWTPGLPGNEMFTNAVTVLESETPTNKIRPIVIEALRAGGIEPRTLSLLMMPPRQNRQVFGAQVPGTGSDYYPVVYVVVGQR